MDFFIDSVLYSYSQIFFCNRRWFGLAALTATFVVPQLGLLALMGVVISNLLAIFLKFDNAKIKSGFYGFNGILFGAAASFYFQVTPFLLVIIILFVIVTFFISSVLENYLAAAFNLPGLSLPFIISLYIFIIFLSNYDFIQAKQIYFADAAFLDFLPEAIKNYFRSVGLILFQSNILSGILLAAALLFFSRYLFILSIIAFACSTIFLNFLLPQQTEYLVILSGFNSILTAFALGGSLIILSKKSIPLVIISTIIVVVFTGFFSKLFSNTPLPLLVLPFNFVVLSVIYSLKFRQEQSEFTLLYFPPGSPEENFYYHQTRRSRFDKFKYLFPELPFFGEWLITQSYNGNETHKENWKYAWDFAVPDSDNNLYSGEGSALQDYYSYNLPVLAPLDGTVVKVYDGIPDNSVGNVNTEKNWGNTIIIQHGNALYSSVSHLKPESIKVRKDDFVKKGQVLAACGNSGRSPIPHIHLQFQSTDKLGDNTIKYPLSNFFLKNNGNYELKTFDYPDENSIVENFEVTPDIKSALDFILGDKLLFSYSLNGKTIEEKWEVKVDIYNNLFIENNFGDISVIYKTEKIFYLLSYAGRKSSALYNFYLLGSRIPLSFHKNLIWEEEYSIASVTNSFVRYLSEFILPFKQIKANGLFRFLMKENGTSSYAIVGKIFIKGSGIFAFFKKEKNGEIHISKEGKIDNIIMHNTNKTFYAKNIRPGDEE